MQVLGEKPIERGPMTIAMVSEHASPLSADGTAADFGQQSSHVAELARAFGQLGHTVRIYTRRDSAAQPERVPLAPGVEVVHVPAGPARPVPPAEQLRESGAFGAWLSRDWASDRPDLVHAHFWLSGLAALSAARPYGLPVVQTFHTLGTARRGAAEPVSAERARLEAAIGRTADLVLATSEEEVSGLIALGVPRRGVALVPSGVDAEHFSPAGPADDRTDGWHRLIAVGRLAPYEGYEQVIQALSRIPDTEFLIAAGAPPEHAEANAEARRLHEVSWRYGVADRVKLVGQVSRAALPALLRSGDVMTCTPWHEPVGGTALEAMATGLPVVANAVGGLRDTVLDGLTGRLLRSRDPGETARVIRRLLTDPGELSAYRVASVDRVRSRYTWARIATETESAYQRALRGAPLGATG
jgi:D-inositol-3-phosphate glycosyltransferase